METITERCPLKIAVLNFHNIKMIIYNFSKILSFPCTLLVMKTFLHILLLLCVFLLTIVWPYWHPYNKILKVSEEEKKLFCILVAVVVVGVSDRKKISRSGGGGGGGRRGGYKYFLKNFEGGDLTTRALWLETSKVAFLNSFQLFLIVSLFLCLCVYAFMNLIKPSHFAETKTMLNLILMLQTLYALII